MMKNGTYGRIELRRAFSQKTMQISMAIGLLLSLWHFIQWPLMRYQPVTRMEMGYPTYPLSAFELCMSSDAASLQHGVFFFLLPLLAALPYGSSLFDDNHSGFSKNLYIRVDRKVMLRSRCRAVFLSGAVAVTLPLLFDFFLTGWTLPLIVPEVTAFKTNLQAQSMGGELFFSWPVVYVLLYLLIDFVFSGLYAVLAMYAGNVFSNRFAALLTPLLFQMAVGYAAELMSAPEWTPEHFLAMSQITPVAFWKVCIVAVLLCVVIFILHERSCKYETII